MAQLLIRKLDDDVKERLRSLAKAHGVSMEEEARKILSERLEPLPRQSTPALPADTRGLGTRIADHFRHIDWGDEELTPLPRETLKPIKFD